jgi:hypothetical protein
MLKSVRRKPVTGRAIDVASQAIRESLLNEVELPRLRYRKAENRVVLRRS